MNLNLLKIRFTGQIQPWEVPALRGAVGRKVGAEGVLFHHHAGDRLLYQYPLIQYGQRRGQPQIVCLGEGVEAIHQYFQQPDWSVDLGQHHLEMKVDEMDLQAVSLGFCDPPQRYRLLHWVALNQKNYAAFQRLAGLVERTEFLERKLVGNILSFAKGVGWRIEGRIDLRILDWEQQAPIKIKGTPFDNFHVKMQCNLHLPTDIGLGGKVSLGMGRVLPDP